VQTATDSLWCILVIVVNKYISKTEKANLTRKIHPLPSFIDEILRQNNVVTEYKSRPAYQKNDYIGWIMRAKREETQLARIEQMIMELKAGNKYMKMNYDKSSSDKVQ